MKKEYLFVLAGLLLAAIAFSVIQLTMASPDATNPGHPASGVGGTDIADRTFQNADYSFPGTSTLATTSITTLTLTTPLAYTQGGTGTSTILALQNLWWGNGSGGLVQVASSTLAGAGLSGGQTNYIPYWTSATALGTSTIYNSSGDIGMGTTTPQAQLHIYVAPGASALRINTFKVKPISATSTGVYDSGENLIMIFDEGN